MTKKEQFKIIIETFINGNLRDSFKKSDDFGIYEFVYYLNHTEILSIEEKNRFLTAYIRYKAAHRGNIRMALMIVTIIMIILGV